MLCIAQWEVNARFDLIVHVQCFKIVHVFSTRKVYLYKNPWEFPLPTSKPSLESPLGKW